MDNAPKTLTTQTSAQLQEQQKARFDIVHKQEIDELSSLTSPGFLPMLVLIGSANDALKEGKCERGWAIRINKDQYEYLGPEVNIIVFTFRSKAMDISNTEQIVSVFNKDNPEWARIEQTSEIANSGCMWGPEFLVFIPSAKGQQKWATYYASSKTARREARNFIGILKGNCQATLKYQLIDNKRYKWDGPKVYPCSLPLQAPPAEEIQQQVDSFSNPKDTDIEYADESTSDRER